MSPEPVCPRCMSPLGRAPAVGVGGVWLHAACMHAPAAPVQAELDALEPAWIALIYLVSLVPVVQPVSFWVRRALMLAWRDRYPVRVAQLRLHGGIADMIVFLVLGLAFVALVGWFLTFKVRV